MPKWTPEQTQAIEKSGNNIIVSAGAGSGKTAVLTERVIHKIKSGVHINELLVLTFTKAAAEEMKDRIRKKLQEDNFLDELNALDSAYVTTFDSFSLSVVKKYHYLLNIPKDIDISDDSIVKLKKKKLLDETFEYFYQNNDEEFENFIQKFCLKSDELLKKSLLGLANKCENYLDKEEFLDNLSKDFFSEEHINNLIKEYEKFINEKKRSIKFELDDLSHYFDHDYFTKIEQIVLPILNTDSLTNLWCYKVFKLPAVPKNTDEEAKTKKGELKKSLDNLLSYSVYGDEEEIKKDILSTKTTVNTIIKIFKLYFEKLKNYKEENQIYTFNDIASLSIKILKEYKEAREELKHTFKEIMVDEYQDTNDIQETFISLIANNNVYMVGDVKQSIYRFRGSNPNIFKEKYDNFSKNIGGYKIDLIKNFRSRKEVLNNINRLFDLIMDNEIGGAEYYLSHEMVYGNTSYDDNKQEDFNYDFEVLEYQNSKDTGFSNSEVEIFTIARDIKKKMQDGLYVFDKETSKQRKATYSDFVIILDRSKYFDDFKRIFEYLDIPLTILKDGKLNTSNDLLIIKNIIDFIIRINNKDYGVKFKYDFLSIGRSFLYEYSDEYLFDVITNNEYFKTTLYNDFVSISDFASLTSSELFNIILEKTDFYNKINKIGDFQNINVRLATINELAKNLNQIGMDITDFRDYLEEIITSGLDINYTAYADNSDSVKILTIHKSKGLEYPICYFADLDHEFNTMELKDKFVIDKFYGIITPTENESVGESICKPLYKDAFMKEEIGEKIRLFYVALTRAREKMIIVLPEKETYQLPKNEFGTIEGFKRLKFTSLSDILYASKNYLKEYFKSIDINKLNLTKDYLYNKPLKTLEKNSTSPKFEVEEIHIENELVEQEHFSKNLAKLVDKETKNNMEFGTKVHEIFEFVDFKNYNPNEISDTFIREKVSKFLEHDLLKNIQASNIYKEYEFMYEKDNNIYHGIIDLMLEYDDHIDIIDYKLKNTVDENYIKQLNGYKEYINSISNKPVNTYLYSIIDEEIKEVR